MLSELESQDQDQFRLEQLEHQLHQAKSIIRSFGFKQGLFANRIGMNEHTFRLKMNDDERYSNQSFNEMEIILIISELRKLKNSIDEMFEVSELKIGGKEKIRILESIS